MTFVNLRKILKWKFFRCNVQGMLCEVFNKTKRGRLKENNIDNNSIYLTLLLKMFVFYLQSRLLGIPDAPTLPPFLLSFLSSFILFPTSLHHFLPSLSSYPKLDGEDKRKTFFLPGVWEQERTSCTEVSGCLKAREVNGTREQVGLCLLPHWDKGEGSQGMNIVTFCWLFP